MNLKSIVRSAVAATAILALSGTVTQAVQAQSFSHSNTGWGWFSDGRYWFLSTENDNNPFTMNFDHESGYFNFSTKWSGYNNEFVGGTGWSQGWRYHTIGYNCGIYDLHGGGMFGVYGWVYSPDHVADDLEYYVVEMSDGHGPGAGFAKRDTFWTDGAWYDVYSGEPGGNGLSGARLEQYISVRQGNNSAGVNHNVTMANHFDEWRKLGWRQGYDDNHLGDFHTQAVCIESWGNSNGNINASSW